MTMHADTVWVFVTVRHLEMGQQCFRYVAIGTDHEAAVATATRSIRPYDILDVVSFDGENCREWKVDSQVNREGRAMRIFRSRKKKLHTVESKKFEVSGLWGIINIPPELFMPTTERRNALAFDAQLAAQERERVDLIRSGRRIKLADGLEPASTSASPWVDRAS